MSTAANWEGMLKRRYGAYSDPMPSPNTFADYMEFIPKEQRPGDTYEFPVALGLEHGVTHDNTRTAFTLLGAKDSIVKPARLRGAAINMQGKIPRDMLAAMANGNSKSGDSGGSYFDGLDAKVMGLSKGAEFYRELALHYGPGAGAAGASNIGVVSTIVSGTNLGAGGPIVCDLTRGSWSAGLWNLMVGALVDIYEADHTTLVESDVEVLAVNPTLNRVTLAKTGVTTDVDATDVIIQRSAKGKSCMGVQPILENATTLFEINAATYPQWRAISFAVGGAVTRAKILNLAARLQQNGLKKGGKMFVNANTFAVLAEEAAALQRFTGNTEEIKRQGAENLEYKTPAGVVEVAVDMVMKQGIFMFLAKGVGKRVGSTDNTFRTQGSREWFFQELENAAGAQLQCFSNQAPVLETPYWCAIGTGVTNTGDTLPSA